MLRRRSIALVATVLAFASLFACQKKKEGDACLVTEQCDNGLFCVTDETLQHKCRTQAEADAMCRSSKECAAEGNCTWISNGPKGLGGCWPVAAADCKQSSECAASGACSLVDAAGGVPRKQCGATTDDECRSSAGCKNARLCAVDAKTSKCVATKP